MCVVIKSFGGYFVGPPLKGIGGGEPFSSTPPLTCCTLACG